MDLSQLNKRDIFTGKVCPYCGKATEFVDSKEVYAKSYGNIYLCRDCNAWVGVHKGTDRALGRVANQELRNLKTEAHNLFDRQWKQLTVFGFSLGKARRLCYSWLATQFNFPVEWTHIGMFDEEQCRKVIQLVNELNLNGGAGSLLSKEQKSGYIQNTTLEQQTQSNSKKEQHLINVRHQMQQLANNLGLLVTYLSPYQIRFSKENIRLDIYPVNKKFHDLYTGDRGDYWNLDKLVQDIFSQLKN